MNSLNFGVPILFGNSGNHTAYAGQGWSSTSDADTTWNDGCVCTLQFRVAALRQSAQLVLQARPFIVPGQIDKQELTIYLNGLFVTYVRVAEAFTATAMIDRDQLSTRFNTVSFVMPHAASPQALGLSGDERKLGLAFVRLEMNSVS